MVEPPVDVAAPPAPSAAAGPALALSGGGARCVAQIGVLEVLLEAGVTPVAVAASSSASFLAALWAAGHPPGRVVRIAQRAAAALPFGVDLREGLLGHAAIARALAPHLPDRFEDLAVPVAVVAIDAERGERVVLDSGPLLPALLASNAFPGLFAPVRLEGRVLIDGGGVEMVPVRTAQERWDAPVLAVDVQSPPDLDLPDLGAPLPLPVRRLVRTATRSASLGWTGYVTTQREMVRYQLDEHRPRWLLRPELRSDLGLFRFDRAAEARAAGRACARAAFAWPAGASTR